MEKCGEWNRYTNIGGKWTEEKWEIGVRNREVVGELLGKVSSKIWFELVLMWSSASLAIQSNQLLANKVQLREAPSELWAN